MLHDESMLGVQQQQTQQRLPNLQGSPQGPQQQDAWMPGQLRALRNQQQPDQQPQQFQQPNGPMPTEVCWPMLDEGPLMRGAPG